MSKKPRSSKKECNWTVREWGSLSSIVGTVILLWVTFGPRSKGLPPGAGG